MDIMYTMIIVWGVVIAIAFLLEFLTGGDLISFWFAVGGIAAMISSPCGLGWPWQILVFFVVSFATLLGLRPFTRKFIKVKTTPTNLDANVGKKVKLLKDVHDGRSEIKINDIVWTVECAVDMKAGDAVEILGMAGNKYIVGGQTK